MHLLEEGRKLKRSIDSLGRHLINSETCPASVHPCRQFSLSVNALATAARKSEKTARRKPISRWH